MDATWMIFYRETDLQHYLYNGTKVIAINPGENVEEWHDDPRTREPDFKSKLDMALHSKARGFQCLNRFQITARGGFVSE